MYRIQRYTAIQCIGCITTPQVRIDDGAAEAAEAAGTTVDSMDGSTVCPSVEAGVVAELPDIDFMREIADLFLRAAKLICMSADPQLLSLNTYNPL